MRNIVKLIIHLNIIEGINAMAACVFVFLLLGEKILLIPLILSFFSTCFLYTLNRISDIKEDRINYPERVYFFEKFKNRLLLFFSFFYALSLLIAIFNSLFSFVALIFPFILVFSYSFFRLKRFLFLKNLIVALGWSVTPFFVLTYVKTSSFLTVYASSIIIFISVLINTIIFDIKDIKGDKMCKIFTLPNVYGIVFAKRTCYFLSVILLGLICLFLHYKIISQNFVYLLLFPLYILGYVNKVTPKNAILVSEYVANLDMIVLSILSAISIIP